MAFTDIAVTDATNRQTRSTPSPNSGNDPLSGQKIYRLAVYGGTASGKTCILAALAMNRTRHPKGYTGEWPPVPQTPPGARGRKAITAEGSAYARGKEWLEQAIRRLEKGEVPEPNPPEDKPRRFYFQFTIPDRGTAHVELVDYSGELIDPNLSEERLAGYLRQHLAQCDGLLVLAEAPLPQKDSQPLAEELLKLRKAFAALKNERREGSAIRNVSIGLRQLRYEISVVR